MKNKKRIIILSLIIAIIIIIFCGIIAYLNNNRKITSITDFRDIKEIIEFYGGKYISTKDSSEEGYNKDIFVEFAEEPIGKKGENYKNKYETIISCVYTKANLSKIRIIDETKNLTIRIYSTNGNTVNYTINGLEQYFLQTSALNESKTYNEKITQIEIKSNTLSKLINSNWNRRISNLGTPESEFEGYDLYFSQGFKTRTLSNKIFNIIFLNGYREEVFENINTGMKNDDIEKILGKPTFEDKEIGIIGYKAEQIYVFFSNGEISIYRIENYNEDENKQFIEAFTQFKQNKDTSKFLSKLTDLWNDYDSYEKNDNYIKLTYTLRGIEITLGSSAYNGITLYSNYQGNVSAEMSIEDVKNGKELPSNVYLQISNNLIFQKEKNRAEKDELLRKPYTSGMSTENGDYARTKSYTVLYDNVKQKYTFSSINRTEIDSELNVENVTGIYEITDTVFAYGVKDSGIYVYNTHTMKNTKIVTSQGNNKIRKIENNTIYYDDSEITVK